MNGRTAPRPYGLRLTMRHQMILVAYAAAVLALIDTVRRGWPGTRAEDAIALAWLASPWCLGLLFMTLDEPGPVRNWLSCLLLMLFAPALALYHDATVVADIFRSGTWSSPITTLGLNAIFLGSFAYFWHLMAPGHCPHCGRRALIPLMRAWGQTKRTNRTRWCAACGRLFWGRPGGPWRPERRFTWATPAVDPLGIADEADVTGD